MRRTASIGWLALAGWLLVAVGTNADAGEICWADPVQGRLVCEDQGGTRPPVDPKPKPKPKPYLYVTTRAGVGECYYWSSRPGGLDTGDPANDPAVISILRRLEQCPAIPAVNVEAAAWSIFRSWSLAAPSIELEPAGVGITGLPTYLATPEPAAIAHQEVLPDGRTLRVRAEVTLLTVRWGDGTSTTHTPDAAYPYPTGLVTHVFSLKTCTDGYRQHHPSGGLCHPRLDSYPIRATFTWSGSYNAGRGWIDLGTLDRTAATDYEVDEARGTPLGRTD